MYIHNYSIVLLTLLVRKLLVIRNIAISITELCSVQITEGASAVLGFRNVTVGSTLTNCNLMFSIRIMAHSTCARKYGANALN